MAKPLVTCIVTDLLYHKEDGGVGMYTERKYSGGSFAHGRSGRQVN